MTSSSSAAAVVATLVPIHDDSEELKDGLIRRPILQIQRDGASPLVLGRNHTTGIASPNIPKNAATVCYLQNKNQVWLERHSHHCSVIRKQDGAVVPLSASLQNGDVVRLYKQDYAYRVEFNENDEKNGTIVLQQTSEECMCAVCMEIMVSASAVVPCGHVFCKECLSGITECPNCRFPVQSALPIKTMDNVISKLVESSLVFSETDVQHYQSRVQPPPPAVSSQVCCVSCILVMMCC